MLRVVKKSIKVEDFILMTKTVGDDPKGYFGVHCINTASLLLLLSIYTTIKNTCILSTLTLGFLTIRIKILT